MKNLLLLLAHLLTTLARVIKPGGARAVVAENLLLKQQLLVLHRSRRRAPNLGTLERVRFGFWALLLSPHRIRRAAVVLRPSSLLRFHAALQEHKYR
jgi:putative transposase